MPLRGPVSTIQTKIDDAKSAADSANLAAKLLPDMLGQKGTRRYLLLVQNNAEIRSTGGIPGSFAILKAKNGKLSMGFQGSYQDLKQFTQASRADDQERGQGLSPDAGDEHPRHHDHA